MVDRAILLITPRADSSSGHPITCHMTSVREAPRAMRIPSSWVRCLVMPETMPYNPIEASPRVTSVRIEMTELMPDGRPAEATFRFRVPLEDSSLRWFQITDKGYEAFEPPAIGQTVEVESPL